MTSTKTKAPPIINHCKLCGNKWEQRLPLGARPKQCPNCKQLKWDQEPKDRKKKAVASEPDPKLTREQVLQWIATHEGAVA